MGLAEIFRVFYLKCLIVPYLFSYYRTDPIQLNQLNSNNIWSMNLVGRITPDNECEYVPSMLDVYSVGFITA